jgi:hypothetical protein
VRPLEPAAAVLQEALGAGHAALPFAGAVVRQLDGVPEPGGGTRPRDPAATAGSVAALVRGCERADGPAGGAPAALAADPPLLAAFFQNVDLLYRHGYPHADAVGALVMGAVELLDEAG